MANQTSSNDLAMSTYNVQSFPHGDFEEVRGLDEVDAAERLLQIPLQRVPRSNMHLKALVRGPAHRGSPILLYAKEERDY